MKSPGPPKTIFKGKFVVGRRLGKGGFGEVFAAIQTATNEPVAIKMEKTTNKNSFLFHEAKVMQEIQKHPTADGVAAIGSLKYFGQEGNYRMLIMALHGPSLEDIHSKMRRFSLRSTLLLGIQMLERLEFVHEAGFVHRDLKPDNFVTGGGDLSRRIFLIDFGLSARYCDRSGVHLPPSSGKAFVGTFRYASMRTHEGHSQSRRDDLEQLVYVLIFLYRGRLPWSGLNIDDADEKERKIGALKRDLPLEKICEGCPEKFQLLLNYAREMEFDEPINYVNCRLLLSSILDDFNFSADPYDWERQEDLPRIPVKQQQQQQPPATSEQALASPNTGQLPNIMSKTVGRGMFSGFGSSGMLDNIVSIGNKD